MSKQIEVVSQVDHVAVGSNILYLMEGGQKIKTAEGNHKFVIEYGTVTLAGAPLPNMVEHKFTGRVILEVESPRASIYLKRTSFIPETGPAKIEPLLPSDEIEDPLQDSYEIFKKWAVKMGLVTQQHADSVLLDEDDYDEDPELDLIDTGSLVDLEVPEALPQATDQGSTQVVSEPVASVQVEEDAEVPSVTDTASAPGAES